MESDLNYHSSFVRMTVSGKAQSKPSLNKINSLLGAELLFLLLLFLLTGLELNL